MVSTFVTDQQGLDSLKEFCPLTDEEVKSLVKVTQCPWVTIPNPVVGPLLPSIPNPGIPVTLWAENNLKLMCYLLSHMECTSHTITAAGITITSIHTLCDHCHWDQDHDDLNSPELNAKDWPRTIETIDEWLKGCLRVSKIPLAYMIRDEMAFPIRSN